MLCMCVSFLELLPQVPLSLQWQQSSIYMKRVQSDTRQRVCAFLKPLHAFCEIALV